MSVTPPMLIGGPRLTEVALAQTGRLEVSTTRTIASPAAKPRSVFVSDSLSWMRPSAVS